MQQRARVAWAGLVLAVLIVGGLWLVDRTQTDAQQRRQVERQQSAVALETSAAATSDAIGATMIARQLADGATQQATSIAGAAQSLATLEASRTALAATVTAGQVSAQATNTALARR
jgi:hypothetical protein